MSGSRTAPVYEEYILWELLNSTLTGLSEDGELDQLLD